MRLPFMQPQADKTQNSWDEVVEYLRYLPQADYNKMLKVVQIYRDADTAAKKVLKIKPQKWDVALGLDDTELGNFLDDDEPKSKKVEVK